MSLVLAIAAGVVLGVLALIGLAYVVAVILGALS